MVVLFDAAARFVDRLPGARTEVFLDHVLGQQLPADTIAPSADRGEAVRLLTAHAAKGLEWDFVVVAGVQEGIWPDLRLRGSLLGSERLVDVLAGRAEGAGLAASLAGQASALLDEERRLFYVATTRARRRLLVTAVNSAAVGGADHEEQPSRFLHELLGRPDPEAGPGPAAGGPDAPDDPDDPPDGPDDGPVGPGTDSDASGGGRPGADPAGGGAPAGANGSNGHAHAPVQPARSSGMRPPSVSPPGMARRQGWPATGPVRAPAGRGRRDLSRRGAETCRSTGRRGR